MNNIDIEKMKREIKVKVGGTVVFCGLLFTLMGCGKTVVDTTVEQQPTQTIETTVDDPVVDVPVEPTADVSDNGEVTSAVENELGDATFVQTGENSYTLYVDCPDESNAPEIQETIDRCYNDLWSEMLGVSPNLVNAVMTNGLNSPDGRLFDYDLYKNVVINMTDCDGFNHNYVITDDPTQYQNDESYVPLWDLSYTNDGMVTPHCCIACTVILKDSIKQTNGNLSLAFIRYYYGDDKFNQWMQECVTATGMTKEEICARYDAEFVSQYDALDLVDASCADDVLQYVDGDIAITQFNDSGAIISTTTYTIDRAKTFGSR